MIVFAAHVPHSPLLLPTIGREHKRSFADSLEGMRRLEEDLYASHPDTIVVISSHAIMHETAFSANLHDEYVTDLAEFGDLATRVEFEPDLALMDAIQRSVRRSQIPFTLDSDANLDHGSSVPLVLLTEHLPKVRIVPIAYSGLDAKAHFQFGKALKEVLANAKQRVAVISSGDLSHCLSTRAPGGYKKEGEEFDEAVIKAVEQTTASSLLTIDPEVVTKASECALRPMLVLFGILDGMHARSEILSYEAPFGVGYLVAEFHLH